MIYPVSQAGAIGIIKDVPPYELPPNAWSGGMNVRMKEGSVQKFKGHRQVMGTPTVAPYWNMEVQTASTLFWMYASLTKVYVTDGTTHTNITRQTAAVDVDYTGTADDNWTGVLFGGIPVINNGTNEPQMWNPAQTSQKLQALTAWTTGDSCKAMRAFKQHLIAMDVTKSGTRYPRMVKWSHASAFNAVPSSWDETDDTKDAGEYELAASRGTLLDGLALRDSFILYKDDAIFGMQYIGTPYIFRFYDISLTTGALSRRCIAEFEGTHFVFGIDDCLITTGQEPQTVLNDRIRREVFNDIDGTHYAKSFVVPNVHMNEIWACYPSTGATLPNKALVWNWKQNTFAVRDLPSVGHISYGIVDDSTTPDTWATADGGWDTWAIPWSQKNFNPSLRRLLFAGTNDTKLYLGDDTEQEAGVNMTSFVERTGINIDSSRNTNTVVGVRLYMEATGSVNIYVGRHQNPKEAVTWEGPFSFDPRTDWKIDCRVTGKFHAIKIESTTDVEWKLNGYEMEYRRVGTR